MLKIIDRYFLLEQLKPFLAGVSAFLIIMISNTLYIFMEMIVKNNVAVKTVIRLLLYSLPAIIVVTLPVAYMFATLLSLGRLGRDSEIIALRACGVSLSRCIMPVIAMSVVISGMGYGLQEYVVPWSNRQTVEVLKDIMRRDPVEVLKAKTFLDSENRSFYVEDIDREAGILKKMYIIDKNKSGLPQIIQAETARRQDDKWVLYDGVVRKLDVRGYLDHEIKFERMEIKMEIKADKVFSKQPDVRQVSSGKAAELIDEKKKRGENVNRDLVDYYTKVSLPLATFFTILLAAPIGIKFSRMGNYFGVAISIGLVFVWYVMYSTFSSLGSSGSVPPFLAAWIQNITFGFFGVFFLLQLSGIPIIKTLLFPIYLPIWLKERRADKADLAAYQSLHPSDMSIQKEGRFDRPRFSLPYLLSFQGRLGRLRYLAYFIGVSLLFGLAGYGLDQGLPEIIAYFNLDTYPEYTDYIKPHYELILIGVFAFGGFFYLSLIFALGAKRARDLGRSAWMQLWALLPLIGWGYLFYQFLFKTENLAESAFSAKATEPLAQNRATGNQAESLKTTPLEEDEISGLDLID